MNIVFNAEITTTPGVDVVLLTKKKTKKKQQHMSFKANSPQPKIARKRKSPPKTLPEIRPSKVQQIQHQTIANDDEVENESDPIANDKENESEKEQNESEKEGTPCNDLELFMAENKEPLLPDSAMRSAVAFLFVNKYNAEHDKKKWTGRNGIRVLIRKALGIHENTNLDGIFNDIVACKEEGTTYTGQVKKRSGRPPIIALDSYEAQIAADCVEAGFSIPHAWTVVNQYRQENDLPSLTIAPIKTVIKRLNPLIQKIEKIRQGNKDENSTWCKARNNWDTQILIRTGKLKGDQLNYLRDSAGKLPKWFDPDQMPKLHEDQIGFWDETHRKCVIGGLGTTNEYCAKFPRDANGKIDVKNGTYDDTTIKKLNVKFDKEVRLCLGCAIVPKIDEDGNEVEVGLMCPRFDYSEKCIKSLGEYESLQKILNAEIRESKNTKRWTTPTRAFGSIYEDDNVTILTDIAKVTQEKLNCHAITTVGALKHITDETINQISSSDDKTKRISEKKLITFRKQAALAIKGKAPPPIDHRTAENPWLSKYGEDDWEERQRKSSTLRDYVCVTEMIEHIVTETAKVYAGTKYKDSWMFYHDALSIMTANRTIEWMKEKDYYKRWILPINGLHTDDVSLKYYNEKPVGNCPENMPLDTSLNNDIHCGVKRHVIATWELPEDDVHKFSMSTPKRGVYAYDRVMTEVPCSRRILQDIKQVFKSMDLVRLAKGKMVESVGKVYGRRFHSTGKKSLGGKRERALAPDDYKGTGGGKWLHAHALRGVAAKLDDSKRRAGGEVGTKSIIDKQASNPKV